MSDVIAQNTAYQTEREKMNGKNGSEIVKLLGGKEVSISVEMDDETRNFFELILNMQKSQKEMQ